MAFYSLHSFLHLKSSEKIEILWHGKSNDEVIEALRKQKRTPLPDNFGPQSIIELMNKCWQEDPHQRPTFKVFFYSNLKFFPFLMKKSFLFWQIVWIGNCYHSWSKFQGNSLHFLFFLLQYLKHLKFLILNRKLRVAHLTPRRLFFFFFSMLKFN